MGNAYEINVKIVFIEHDNEDYFIGRLKSMMKELEDTFTNTKCDIDWGDLQSIADKPFEGV
jgi:hypothetical protein